MSDKTQNEFSAWYLSEVTQSYGESVRPQAEKNLAWLRQDGSFADPMLRLASLAWQASRESLVIELPQRWSVDGFESGWIADPDGANLDYSETVKAIEAAGLKVKS